jgi:hypothetical protein
VTLHFADKALGVYDPKTKEYRQFEANGKLSEPVPFPWHSKKAEKTESKTVWKPPKIEVPEEPVQPPNPMIGYLVGGGVMGGILLIGLMAIRRG